MTKKEFEEYRQKVRKERVKIADVNYKAGGLKMLKIISEEYGWLDEQKKYKKMFLNL